MDEMKKYKLRSRVIKALAHPSRLLMVDALAGGEKCVCELTRLVGADISTVSKHLSTLKGAGVVADEKRGNKIFYRLIMCCLGQFMDCVDRVVQDRIRDESGF